ncbi:MarR family transcriptional regulator [Murinocardiopsis flavida]|uniref:MarR family transcriptional regulator n=1 Tax=Murinocardiopsis flavida TaxID=645275 RepID=A0A2P8D969_9ACTN|nr:MarR family transcriptional regulator [Murinocardiopsis flavida]PSK93778.1 MarR family transcriptional regulator [Murinocardiopsis flavida]
MDRPGDDLALDRQLCFAVYAASRAFTGLYRELLAGLGLTYPQYLVMLVLWEREPVAVRELGEALRLDSGTLSPLLRRLDTAGLVRRVRSAADERVVEIALTAEGRTLRGEAERVPDAVLAATGLTLGEADELRVRLDRITASAADATARLRAEAGDRSPTEVHQRKRS